MTLDCTCNRLAEAARKAALWDGIVHCQNCKHLDTMECPVKRALVFDGISKTAVVAPAGHCAWGERREDA